MELLPNSILKNRYRIIELLGKGGMGAVYLAYDTALEQKCAVKINFGTAEHSTNQFIREARLLAALRHPNLPRVIDYFILDDNQFLVMDYIAGRDLGAILDSEGIQPVERVLAWAKQLISALSYLHHQNPPVIHRDIKPTNIKVTPKGEVMLVDFGIAKAVDLTQSTVTGIKGYTPGYAPPEQYGAARTGPYTDQFSLAATLYKLLTNQNPAESMQRILKQDTLKPIHQFNPRVPQNVVDAVERGLSIRPEDRFESVDAFGAALANPNYRNPSSSATVNKAAYATSAPTITAPAPAVASQKRSALGILLAITAVILLIGAVGTAVGYIILSKRLPSISQKPEPSMVTNISQPEITHTPKIVATETLTLQPAQIETVPETKQPTKPAEPTETMTISPTVTPTATQPSPTPELIPIGGGGLIAFISDRGADGIQQIWTLKISMDVSGNIIPHDLTQLTYDEGHKSFLAWSPDGRYLIYSAPVASAGNGLELFSLDVNDLSKPPVQLTNRKGDDTQASWSPDGQTIAFVNNGRDDKIRQIYFMDPFGQNLRRISYDYEEYAPVWSPDGQQLLFVLNGSGHQTIYVRQEKDDFTEPKTYDRTSHFGRLGNVEDVAFSPDGNWLAYTQIKNTREKDVGIVRYSSLGGDSYVLTAESMVDRQPRWSRDSQWIVFVSERDGNPEIYIMDISGLKQTNLSSSAGIDLYPVWQP